MTFIQEQEKHQDPQTNRFAQMEVGTLAAATASNFKRNVKSSKGRFRCYNPGKNSHLTRNCKTSGNNKVNEKVLQEGEYQREGRLATVRMKQTYASTSDRQREREMHTETK